MLVAIKVYVKVTAIRLTAEECMEVRHWDEILTAAGKVGFDRSTRLFPLPRHIFCILVLL